MTAWKKQKLGEVVDKIVGGGTPSKNNPNYWGGSIPWASVKDFEEGKYYLNSTQDLITEEGLKNSSSNFVKAGTVIIPTRMGVGRVVQTNIGTAINQDLKAIYPSHKITNNFLKWSLISSGQTLNSLATGSTVMGIRLEDLKKLEVSLPTLEEQESISSVLDAYNKLIENNEKRIKILEEMAQRLYTEWFVKFKFPGHEKVKLVDSGTEFGMIPEGWEAKKFKDFILLKRGYDLPKVKIISGKHPVIASTSIIGYHNEYKVEPPVITTGRSGSLGTVLLINEQAWPLNTTLYVKDFYNNSSFFVYFTLKNLDLKSYNSGAGVPTLNRNHLDELNLIIPNKDLQKRFDEIESNYFKQVALLKETNKNLTKMRDLLIPQLVTGRRKIKYE